MLLAKIKHLFWYFSILSKQCKKRSRAGIILYSSIDFRRKFFRGRNSVPLRIELSNRALTKSFASDPLIMNNYLWKKRGFFFCPQGHHRCMTTKKTSLLGSRTIPGLAILPRILLRYIVQEKNVRKLPNELRKG